MSRSILLAVNRHHLEFRSGYNRPGQFIGKLPPARSTYQRYKYPQIV